MKNFKKYAVFSLIYLVIIFLVLEVALRIIFPPITLSPPNYNDELVTSEYYTIIKTNSIGLRSDVEYALDKPENTERILVVGNSFTFGTGVNNSNTWCKLLEDKLNEDGDVDYEVINAGKPGIGPGGSRGRSEGGPGAGPASRRRFAGGCARRPGRCAPPGAPRRGSGRPAWPIGGVRDRREGSWYHRWEGNELGISRGL